MSGMERLQRMFAGAGGAAGTPTAGLARLGLVRANPHFLTHLPQDAQARLEDNKYLPSVDVATKENLDELVKVGEGLLKKPVVRVNLESGMCEPVNKETNGEALIRFAKLLSEEKQLRLARSPHGHGLGDQRDKPLTASAGERNKNKKSG